MRILLVEDEESIREVVKLNLELENMEVVAVGNGRIGLQCFQQQHFDLLILDVMMPEMNGLQLCEQIRLQNTQIPIIFLTAKDGALDRITGLRRGADDYLTKPFSFEELLLRIQKLLKRSQKQYTNALLDDVYQFGNGFSIDFATFEARGVQGAFVLTKREVMLLKLLIERKGEIVSRQQILASVWGYDVYPSTRTIDNFLLSFRKYFEQDPKNPQHFLSVRGVGYRFVS